MSRRFLSAVVLLTAFAGPSFAQEVKAAKAPDPLVAVLEKLRLSFELEHAEKTITVRELVSLLRKQHGLIITMGSDLSRAESEDPGEYELRKPAGPQSLGRALHSLLAQRDLTFLVRKDGLEVVSMTTASRESKAPLDETGEARLAVPLISGVFVEKPLKEAVASISEDYDVTIVVAPQAGEAKSAFVSARLLNVPLDQALELLAIQADLRVVQRGNAYLLTTPDQAGQLKAEKAEASP